MNLKKNSTVYMMKLIIKMNTLYGLYHLIPCNINDTVCSLFCMIKLRY